MLVPGAMVFAVAGLIGLALAPQFRKDRHKEGPSMRVLSDRGEYFFFEYRP